MEDWGFTVDKAEIVGLVQDCFIYIANAVVILQFCAKPSKLYIDALLYIWG